MSHGESLTAVAEPPLLSARICSRRPASISTAFVNPHGRELLSGTPARHTSAELRERGAVTAKLPAPLLQVLSKSITGLAHRSSISYV